MLKARADAITGREGGGGAPLMARKQRWSPAAVREEKRAQKTTPGRRYPTPAPAAGGCVSKSVQAGRGGAGRAMVPPRRA